MLRRPKPTLSPNRFKTNEIKSLLETIKNVSNRSVLNEYGIAGGPETTTNDPLMTFKPKKRGLGGLEVPGLDLETEPSLPSLGKDTTTSSGGFGSGSQTTTPKISGPQATTLGGPSTGFRSKTTKAGGFSPGQSDMAQVKGQLGSRAGKFADVGGKPNPGMDYETGAYYMFTEPALMAAAAGGAETLAKAAETIGKVAAPFTDVGNKLLGAGALYGAGKVTGEIMNKLGGTSEDPTKYLTKRTPQATPKLK